MVKRKKNNRLGSLLKGRFTPIESAKASLILSKKRKEALVRAKFKSVSKFAEEKAKLLREEKLSKIKNKIKARQIKTITRARAKASRDAKNIHSPMGFGEALGFSRPSRASPRRKRRGTSQDDFY